MVTRGRTERDEKAPLAKQKGVSPLLLGTVVQVIFNRSECGATTIENDKWRNDPAPQLVMNEFSGFYRKALIPTGRFRPVLPTTQHAVTMVVVFF